MATRTISTKLAIEGEAEYKASLKNINAELSLYKSELEMVIARHKDDANSLAALSEKQSALKGQMDALNQKYNAQAEMLEKARTAQQEFSAKAEELRAKLDALKSSSGGTAEEEKKLAEELSKAEENMQKAANSVTYYQKQLNATERDQYKLTAELGRTEQYLDEARASADKCATSIDQFGKEVKEAGESSEEFAAGTEQSRQGIEQLAAALAAAGVAKTVKEITDELLACAGASAELETALAKLSTLVDTSVYPMADIKAQLVELSNETGVAVGALAEAAYQARSAGVDAANVISFVSTATKTSVAGFTDSATAVDVLTTALNAYKLEGDQAERVASMLVKTQDEGKTSVGELAQNMGRIIPVAAAYNVSLENLTTSYALLTKNGTNTRIATTNLSAMLTELAKDGSTVADVLKEQTGKSFAELSDDGTNLGRVMEILAASVDGDATAFSNLWSSTTAGMAALSLLNSGAEEFNQTLAVMENSSGAVERNFQTMAGTTEMAQQRMANAAANLRIAIGDQLTPALKKLYGTGADAFTWATDFVEANPWVVSAITGLTAAFGILAGGIAAVTVGATALKAALDLVSAHPLILVATAAAGLTAAFVAYTASIDNASGSTKAFTESLQESKAAYDDLMTSMGAEQVSTAKLADSLRDLMAVEGKSTTQKDQIKKRVDELNQAVPGLSLAYDEATDSILNMDTGIKVTIEDIDAMLERAAKQEEYNANIERLNELQDEQREIADRLREAQEQLAEAEADTGEAVERTASSYAAASGVLDPHQAMVASLRDNVDQLTAAQADNAAQIAELTAATDAYNEGQGAAEQQVAAMASRVNELTAQMAELQQSYQESYDAAYASIDKQLGLFNELDGSAKTSIDNLIKTLQGQVDYMDTYAANLQLAMEKGVDEGLVAKLSDGSEKSAQILAAIVKGGEDDIEALNAALASVEEGKENFSATVAQMEEDFKLKLGKINQDLAEAAKEMDIYEKTYLAGQNDAQGLIDGLYSKLGEVQAAYQELAAAGQGAYQTASDQHSPSKKFEKMGSYDIQGLIEGAEAKKAELAATYEAAAQAALTAAATHLPSTLEMPSSSGALERQLESITAAAVNAISDATGRGSSVREVVRVVTLDGKVLVETTFDDFLAYADANGTPIANKQR